MARIWRRRMAAGLTTAALLIGSVGAPAASASASARTTYATESSTSSNWAGYVATGNTFSSVSGSWTVPTAKRTTEGYEATWVGLGGATDASEALEQIGTDSDYVNGQATYTAWYELVPKAPVTLKLTIHPGDKITAKVAVSGTTVTVALSDTTTGKSVTKTLHTSAPDTSSAEWIAEAPSAVSRFGTQVLPLSDFGRVAFSSATATTTDGHTGTISDSAWSATRIDLEAATQGFGGGRGPGRFDQYVEQASSGGATTSSLRSGGSAFSVHADT